jgi:benzoate/toluate 1,2-dioxygenase subunit alpha
LINAPTSIVGHDDLHCYRSIQEGLVSAGSEWVSLHRNFNPSERERLDGTYNGTSEISMRGQFRAWEKLMSQNTHAQ